MRLATVKWGVVAAIVTAWLGWPALAPAQDMRYEKFRLANGMTVIFHEDQRLPVAAINIWFRVGSKDEAEGRTGFAHLFEHLMFMGTERVPGNKFDTIMEAGGGANNASTSQDRTNYYSSGPASLLPTLLWLDADRLEDLARTMDEAKLDKQRDIVRNERRQSYENQPYGKSRLAIQAMLFAPGHPYHHPVIGSHQDLEAATVADVKDFFANFYLPSNATLVVAGAFEPKAIRTLVERLFGTLPMQPEPAHGKAAPASLDGVKRATMVDKVQLPMVTMAWLSPAAYADGSAETDLAASVLATGKTSRLYKRLVYDDKIASSVEAYTDSGILGSSFWIDVTVPPGTDLDRVEQAIDEELLRLGDQGPTEAELSMRKAEIELKALGRLQSVAAVAEQMNEYEFFWGEPNSFGRDLARYRQATPKGVQDWAARVLRSDARVVARILPESPERGETPRDQEPARVDAKPFAPPLPESFKLKNGIPVMLWRKPDLPLVSMLALFRPQGVLVEPARAGAIALGADMLDEGAGELGALAFGDAVKAVGAEFSCGADELTVTATLTVLKRNFAIAAGLAADALRRPRFETQEWERVKRLHLDGLKAEAEEPPVVAARVAARAFYGAEHAYGWPLGGTEETVEKLELEDVKGDWQAFVRPEFLTLLVAGDITVAEAQDSLEPLFGNWTAARPGRAPAAAPAAPASQDHLRVFVVDRPDAVQTMITFLMPGPAYRDPQRPLFRLVGTVLGGSFTSRLNLNLREAHGYTYGARARYAMAPGFGTLAATSSVRADVTGASVKEFLNEFERLKTGDLSAEEATKAREQWKTDVVDSFAGLSGILNEAAERLRAELPLSSLADDMAASAKATAPELNRLAANAARYEQGVLVLVGDKRAILEQTKGLIPVPVEVDVGGVPPIR